MSITSCLISTKQRTLRQGKIILISTQHLPQDLSSWIYFSDLSNLLLLELPTNSAEDIVGWICFRTCKSLCTPRKHPDTLVSFLLKIPMFLLWNYWDFDLKTEFGLWYIPQPKILYIILCAEIIWCTIGILETSLKKDTVY